MTTTLMPDDELGAPVEDRPRLISPGLTTGDHIFRRGSTVVGLTVLMITGAIGIFLGYQSIPTLQRYGLNFLVENQWVPEDDVVGISSVLLGTLQVALLAMLMAFPLALATALYITEYSPARIRSATVGPRCFGGPGISRSSPPSADVGLIVPHQSDMTSPSNSHSPLSTSSSSQWCSAL